MQKATFPEYQTKLHRLEDEVPIDFFYKEGVLIGPSEEVIQKVSGVAEEIHRTLMKKAGLIKLIFLSTVVILGYWLFFHTLPVMENMLLAATGSIILLVSVYYNALKPKLNEIERESHWYRFIISSCMYLDDNWMIRDHIYRLAQDDKQLREFLRKINKRDLTWYEAAEILEKQKARRD